MSAPVTAEELAEIERAEDFGEWWEEEPGEGCVYEYTDEGARRIIGPIEPQDAAEVVQTRDRMFRLARDLTAERDTSKQLAERCLDLGRELEALRAAVRAHEAATVTARAADLDLWAAAKT